jgi:ribosomal protein S6--L-glutamate ligase
MILSYHPIFVGDENRLCAGREPDAADRDAMTAAAAVILPQGAYRSLYEMARAHCAHVFPGQDPRFSHPGKTGQARLFAAAGVPHPHTQVFATLADLAAHHPPRPFPFVLKLDWGGEGRNVIAIDSSDAWSSALERVRRCEATGQFGFVVQEMIPAAGRALRVALIGRRAVAYWRVRPDAGFAANLAHGARIDRDSDPRLIAAGVAAARRFCTCENIDLAGLDFLFREGQEAPEPLFLEINWIFGRQGLGGSQRFYEILAEEIHAWLNARGLAVGAANTDQHDVRGRAGAGFLRRQPVVKMESDRCEPS